MPRGMRERPAHVSRPWPAGFREPQRRQLGAASASSDAPFTALQLATAARECRRARTSCTTQATAARGVTHATTQRPFVGRPSQLSAEHRARNSVRVHVAGSSNVRTRLRRAVSSGRRRNVGRRSPARVSVTGGPISRHALPPAPGGDSAAGPRHAARSTVLAREQATSAVSATKRPEPATCRGTRARGGDEEGGERAGAPARGRARRFSRLAAGVGGFREAAFELAHRSGRLGRSPPVGVGDAVRARAPAAPRTRCAASAGTCRPGDLAGGSRPRRAAPRSAPAWSGCRRRRRCASARPRRCGGRPSARGPRAAGRRGDVGRAGLSTSSRIARRMSPAKNQRVVTSLSGVLDRVGDRGLDDLHADTSRARAASEEPRWCRSRSRGRTPARGRGGRRLAGQP